MIITKTVLVKFNSNTATYYRSHGYVMEYGKTTEIKVEDLTHGSSHKIEASCDICGSIKQIGYKHYIYQTEKLNIFACSHKCKVHKIKITKNERYGSPGYSNQEKAKSTKLERYGDEGYNNKEKRRSTNQERYGVDNTYQSEIHKEKRRSTMNEKYGDENYNNIEKTKSTKLKRYGDENYNNTVKSKSTRLEKYGDENYNNREKSKITWIDKYGVDNPMKCDEIHQKSISSSFLNKTHKKTNITYQGTYELDFLEKYNEKLEIKKHKGIEYEFEGSTKKYFPDFYIPSYNLIIEIKSKYWFEKRKDLNLAKMESCKNKGFNFIFIIDQNYEELNNLINTNI